ncbi:ASPIC and UnbV [Stieleria neptunia]|uniref:ASPIC and UnbV n=1 Tax=Stieleria neptunia TaxID=2527979 RepID=A0A518HL37_9BACT|nr:FG-GAP-like repeat-containing protein [Stieleria neptunia]QDV41565.1 ASPIC and UnbV [Stieleria neptunia]
MTDRTIHLTFLIAIALALSIGCRHSETPEDAVTADAQNGPPLPTLPSDGVTTAEPQAVATADPPPQVKMDRAGVIAKAERLEQQGDWRGAESALRSLLLVDPNDHEVLFRMAHLAAGRGDLADAIDVLKTIPADHPDAGLPALGQAADWSFQLGRYQDAERGYLKILEQVPQAAQAHRKLAFLYNRQGRRHEAVAHVRQLCRQGNVRQDELHSLIQPSDAMYDSPSEPPVAADQQLYHPIGVSGEARKLFMDENFRAAVDVLHDSVDADQQPPSIVAFYGRAAAEAQDDVRFHWWLGKVDARTKQFSEYWAAIGTYWWTQRKPEQAARALLEALDRDPTDFRSIVRLRAALEALGRSDDAEQWSERWKALRNVSQENNRIADAPQPAVASMIKLAKLLESLDRRLESVLWKSLAAHYQRAPRNVLQMLQTELVQVVNSEQGFPETATRLCGMRLDEFPLPAMNLARSNIPTPSGHSAPAPDDSVEPTFENVAGDVGLKHAFHVASASQDRGFSVYQSVGGAVAVIDYDLDGQTDLYFTQGGADPPMYIGRESNVLYRQSEGQLVDVTEHAGAKQNRYSTGVTVGDWNQDGFADLVVVNVGQNSLWINSGDGTFRVVNFDDRDDKTILTTSLAMADLNGDAVPDVFELNYLHDPAFSKRPAVNELGQVVGYLKPAEFNPGTDRWITNDGKGQASFRLVGDPESAAASGLGVIVGDFDDRHPGNEVFVGNDTDPNQLWVRGNGAGENRWSDVAMSRGCAFGFDGVPTASMGVAAGDFDQNGALDFHVTNFQDENVSLFLNQDGMFQDRNVGFGLAGPSSSVLGFGTQAIDYNNDGTLDLVVTNGHIEQSAAIPDPFEQPPQLFRNLGNRFELCDVSDPSGYWSGRHVGRGLARLDFNRDGNIDVAVTHLGETSALLINRTETQNHWIQIQLVGTRSERDAIGAKVDVQVGDRSLSQWVVAGDGFFCRNEAVVAFGLGNRQQVDQLSIRWPSGRRQQLNNLAADRRLLIVEGDPDPFELW